MYFSYDYKYKHMITNINIEASFIVIHHIFILHIFHYIFFGDRFYELIKSKITISKFKSFQLCLCSTGMTANRAVVIIKD